MKFDRSQLFTAFVLFWIGLGWLALLLTVFGYFFAPFFAAYAIIGVSALSYCVIFGWDALKKINKAFFAVLGLMFFAIIVFSWFSSPSVFSGRDQGSLSEAAIRLSENHQLKFSFKGEREFFQIYGPGKALNFPGFNYLSNGELITQFPLGYIAWLAIFYSFFGLNGLILANAVSFLLFLLSFYFLIRLYLKTERAVFGLFFVLTSFVFAWFFKFTLGENLALALTWFSLLSFMHFIHTQKRLYLLASILSFGLLIFTRIETLSFLVVMLIILYLKSKYQLESFFSIIGKKIILLLGAIFLVYIFYFFANQQLFAALLKDILRPFLSSSSESIDYKTLLGPFLYVVNVFYAYAMHIFAIFGTLGILYFLKQKKEVLLPLAIILPSFIYLFYPNISPDHPWMLRRFLFTVIPAIIFYAVLFLGSIFKKRLYFYLVAGIVLLINVPVFVKYLPIVPHKKLLSEIENISDNFRSYDLVLIDRETTGDGWSMLTGPMSFLFKKQAVYFFNTEDFFKINTHNYSEVYLLIPDSKASFYREKGLLSNIRLVKNYTLENNFLQSEILDKNTAYFSPVISPTEKKVVVSGKLYLLKK
jgi:hypothetical protein